METNSVMCMFEEPWIADYFGFTHTVPPSREDLEETHQTPWILSPFVCEWEKALNHIRPPRREFRERLLKVFDPREKIFRYYTEGLTLEELPGLWFVRRSFESFSIFDSLQTGSHTSVINWVCLWMASVYMCVRDLRYLTVFLQKLSSKVPLSSEAWDASHASHAHANHQIRAEQSSQLKAETHQSRYIYFFPLFSLAVSLSFFLLTNTSLSFYSPQWTATQCETFILCIWVFFSFTTRIWIAFAGRRPVLIVQLSSFFECVLASNCSNRGSYEFQNKVYAEINMCHRPKTVPKC